MGFIDCMNTSPTVLMEGALGERLKREYHVSFDEQVAMGNLVNDEKGKVALKAIWQEYIQIAKKYNLPFLATTPTRRANKERVALGGYEDGIILENVEFLRSIQNESEIEMYIGGLMGCKGDAYTGEGTLSKEEAYRFHQWQADLFCRGNVDFLYAGIMPNLMEAAGMAQAMAETGIPYIISFTIQSDGRLIDGTSIADAILYIDNQNFIPPVCYMTNCVHPAIVYEALSVSCNGSELVGKRFWGVQGNTSPFSYAELDNSPDLKCSKPKEFTGSMLKLKQHKSIKIFGGCCGTDCSHMEYLAQKLIEFDEMKREE